MEKKKIVAIIISVLVLSVSFRGTIFAWFINSKIIELVQFTFASVDFNAEEPIIRRYGFKNFNESECDIVNSLKNLEEYSNNDMFEEFWNNGEIIERYLVELGDTENLKVGGILSKEYKFTNNSTIPVYFRIAAPKVSENVNALYIINFKGIDNELIIKNEDNWYLKEPLTNGDIIIVEIAAYFPHKTNKGISNVENFDITIEYAEIIQGTNNAVFLISDDGWKNASQDFAINSN